MKTSKLLLIIPFVALAILLTMSKVYAPTTPTATYGVVWTTDGAGNAKVMFDITDTIYIHWAADGSVNIEIKSETKTYGPYYESANSGVMDFTPSEVGFHTVSCTGANVVEFAVGKFFVVPDLPLGTLMGLVACFAGFGIMKLRKST